MLVQAKALNGYKLHSLDGDIGSTKEFYFDDRYWTIRYLVANTGNWLTGRKVLISPYSLNEVSPTAKEISVQLTKAQIEASPSIDSDEPVSRQFENSYYGYMAIPLTGAASTHGDTIHIRSGTAANGARTPRTAANGTAIFVAPTR